MTLCPSRGGVMVVRSTAPSSALGWYSGGAVLNGAKCSSNSRSAACAKTGAEQMGESVINAASTANGAHAVRLWAQMLGETLSMPVSLAENLQRWQITVVHLAHMRGGTAKCGDGMEVQTRTNAPQKQMGPALLPTPLLPAHPKSKLGRHCCRPHSYQRVVFFFGEPSKKRLASDAFTLQRIGGFPYRCSHQHPVPFPAFRRFQTEAFLHRTCFHRYRDQSSIVAFVLKRLVSGLSLLPSIVRLPNVRSIQWISDRVLLKQPAVRLTEAFFMTCLKDRVDNHHRVSWVQKIP